MLRLLSLGDTEVRSQSLHRFVRSTTAVEVLCILLVALVLIWSKAPAAEIRPVLALIAAFGGAIVAFRARRFFPRQTQIKLSIESWTMMLFITGVLWFTGKLASPLLNLYLLPVILSALTLGRAATMVQIGAIFVCHMAMAGNDPNTEVFSLLYASVAVGTLTPFFLVAYLTTSLSADVNEAREHLENLAQIDELTGALNMRAFNDVLQKQHRQIEKEQGVYAVIALDIDKLKSINESFGHEFGNSAIVLVAQSIQRSIRSSDFGARLSAGEFAVLLPFATPEIAEIVVKRIRHQVYNTTLDVRSRMIRCSVSIGVASYPKDGRDPRELMSLADRRMRRDKELRRPPPAA
jgi:diguanylate cyclase (GGDEF)-like protein